MIYDSAQRSGSAYGVQADVVAVGHDIVGRQAQAVFIGIAALVAANARVGAAPTKGDAHTYARA